MNRTLRRPMFRIGGSAEGITSGLAPRQGYATGLSDTLRKRKISDVLSGATTLGEAEDLAKAMAYKPRGTNVYDFLTEFGLDIASRSPVKGGILATAATSAKEPYQRFMERKGTAAEQQYASESGMFKTLIEGAAAATGEEGLAGKTAQWKSEMVPVYLNTIATIGAIPEKERTKQQNIDLDAATINLDNLKEDNPYISFFLDNPKLGEALVKKIKPMLLLEDQKLPEDQRKYDPELGEDDPQLIIDTFIEFRKQVEEMSKAEGGRIGYQAGNTVMPGAMPTDQGAMPTDQGSAPEDMGPITYEELRARLPQEISDDIVRLLANSAEALEDFAMIQTEQDINNFNRKYGVTLVLPAEG
jgi:hypothetical protein